MMPHTIIVESISKVFTILHGCMLQKNDISKNDDDPTSGIVLTF